MATQERTRHTPAAARRRRDAMGFWREYDRDQKLFIVEAMLNNSTGVITGGVFLTGLLVYMGASNLMVGLVTSAGTWSLMLSLISSVVMERARRKKALMAWSLALFRLLTTLPVFLPALIGTGVPTAFTAAVMMVAGNAVFSLFNTGFPVFLMESIPQEGRVPYIYSRMLFLRIAYTVASVLMGVLLDALHKSYLGFIIVYVFAIAISVADVVSFVAIRGQGGTRQGPAAVAGIGKKLFEPFHNRRYLRFLAFTLVYFFFFFTASSYTALYQVKYLNLSYAFLTIYSTGTYVLMIAVTRRWAAAEARLGSLKVLVLCTLLVPLDFIVYTFMTTRTLWLVPLSVLFSGLGSSGLWACILPYRYSLMPEEGKTVYEGWYGFIFGAANLLGALAGGKLQAVIPQFHLFGMAFSSFQSIYMVMGAFSVATAFLFWRSARKDPPANVV